MFISQDLYSSLVLLHYCFWYHLPIISRSCSRMPFPLYICGTNNITVIYCEVLSHPYTPGSWQGLLQAPAAGEWQSKTEGGRETQCPSVFPQLLFIIIGGTKFLPAPGAPLPIIIFLCSANSHGSLSLQSFSTDRISFPVEKQTVEKDGKSWHCSSYTWLVVFGTIFLQLEQKLSAQLPCFWLEVFIFIKIHCSPFSLQGLSLLILSLLLLYVL